MRTWKDHNGFEHLIIETEEEADELRRLAENVGPERSVPWWGITEALRNYKEANERADEVVAFWENAESEDRVRPSHKRHPRRQSH